MKVSRIGAWLFGACLLALPAPAADADRTLITDPDVLASMGFPRDAREVYRNGSGGERQVVPEDFGAIDTFITLPPKSFMPREDPTNTAAYNGGTESCCGNLTRLAGDTFWDAPIYFPSGVLLKEFTLYANDTDANDMSFFIFERCQAEAGGPTTSTTLATGSTTGATGNQAVSGLVTPNLTVNNRNCSYMARVNMQATTGLTLQKIRGRFARQVSPAPAVATFTDVPVGDPILRFVEALVAAGITGGCGGGNYCPNAPLTRGQMAIFLSVGLGLSFQ